MFARSVVLLYLPVHSSFFGRVLVSSAAVAQMALAAVENCGKETALDHQVQLGDRVLDVLTVCTVVGFVLESGGFVELHVDSHPRLYDAVDMAVFRIRLQCYATSEVCFLLDPVSKQRLRFLAVVAPDSIGVCYRLARYGASLELSLELALYLVILDAIF